MLPSQVDDTLFASRVEVVCHGTCDALVLTFFEKQREAQSKEWTAGQRLKGDRKGRALAEWLSKDFILADGLGLADVVAGSVLGYVWGSFRENPWTTEYPGLATYSDRVEKRKSFEKTVPSPHTTKTKIL